MSGILAIDQGTRAGWAWCAPGCEPMWGNKKLGREGATSGEVGAAFDAFLLERIDYLGPRFLVYEAPYVPRAGQDRVPINAETLRRLLGLAFLIDTIAAQRGIECREVLSAAATKAMTGRGKYPSRQAKKLAT